MKEPMALIPLQRPICQPQRPVSLLLQAGDYAAAVDGMWAAAVSLFQGEQNFTMQELGEWLEALPAPWDADPRTRYLRSWVLFDQCRTTLALFELDQLAAEWAARQNGSQAAESEQWLLLIQAAQGLVLAADGRHEQARYAFDAACQRLPGSSAVGTGRALELDSQEAERLVRLDRSGLTGLAVRVLPIFQATGDRAGLARDAQNLGQQYLDIGEPAQARQWLEQALDLKRGLPGEFPLVYTLDSLGRCYQQLGMLAEAQSLLDEALRITARLGAYPLQASCLSCLADVCRDRDESTSALDLYRRAQALRGKLRDNAGLAETMLAMGALHRRNGHAGLAADCAAEALTLIRGQASPLLRLSAAMQEAIARLLLGDNQAESALTVAVDGVARMTAPGEELLGRWYLAYAAWCSGRRIEAGAHLRQALAIASRHRLMHLLAMELSVTAEACAAALGPDGSAQPLAALVQRASGRGLVALLRAVPAIHPLVAAAGRLPEATSFTAQLLGPFRVVRAGREIDLGAARSQKAVLLFKFLMAHRGRAVAREQILEAIWPEADPDSADRSFEVTLSTLRRLLDPPQGVTLILRRGRGYLLNPDVPVSLDVERFRSHLERGNWWCRRGQTALAVAEWEQAEAAYGGDFLADDPYEDWATAERERLRELYLDLVLRLGEAALAGGQTAEAAERAHRVIMADPIREAAYRLLMRAQARQGNRAVALRTLHRCAELLRQELGEEPMPETRDLARRILAGEIH